MVFPSEPLPVIGNCRVELLHGHRLSVFILLSALGNHKAPFKGVLIRGFPLLDTHLFIWMVRFLANMSSDFGV